MEKNKNSANGGDGVAPGNKIYVSVPTLTAHLHVELVSRLIAWAKQGAFVTAIAGVSPIDHARNEAVRVFLKHDYTHLLFIDDDTVPPMDAIKKLLAVDADVATGITPILRKDDKGEMVTAWNAFISRTDDTEKQISTMETVDADTGIQDVVSCGGSCVLIKREVFLKVKEPWFLFEWNKDYTGFLGEDLYFCNKVRAAGLTIKCDTSVKCGHCKPVML